MYVYYLVGQYAVKSVQDNNAAGSAIREPGATVATKGYESRPGDGKQFNYAGTRYEGENYDTGRTKTVRVGRWMSILEYEKMVETGKVQISKGNMTHVSVPADIGSYRAAPKGSIYVEFDIEADMVVPGGRGDWGIIPGPNTMYDYLRQKRGGPPILEMPTFSNIEIKGRK